MNKNKNELQKDTKRIGKVVREVSNIRKKTAEELTKLITEALKDLNFLDIPTNCFL